MPASTAVAGTGRPVTTAYLLAAAALLIVAALAFSPAIFNDGDTSWHLAAGRLILAAGAVPHTDPFSYTFSGQPWVAHEWLAEVAMAAAHQLGGWGAVAMLPAAAVGALLLLIGSELNRALPLRRTLVVLALVAALLAPFALARPHVLAWPLLAGWTLALLRARDRHSAPHPLLPLAMLLWANLHASYMLGLGLFGVFALEALLVERDRWHQALRWSAVGAASLAAALLTPHGVSGLLYPLQVSGMKALPLVLEWRRTTLSEDTLFLAVAAGTALLLLVRRPPIPILRLLLLAGLLSMALLHARHQAVLVILAPLLLARAQPGRPARFPARAVALLAAGVLALAVVRVALPLSPPDSVSNPRTAIAALPPSLRAQPVLNSYGFGGPLILAGARPYIDGRGDMYGDAFLFDHARIVGGDARAFQRAVTRYDIRWTLLEPGSPLIAALDRSPSWRRSYADRWAVLHVRR